MAMYPDNVVGGGRTLPACLSEPVASLQSRFLTQELSRYLVACKFKLAEGQTIQQLMIKALEEKHVVCPKGHRMMFFTDNPYAAQLGAGASIRCDSPGCSKTVDVPKGVHHCVECRSDYCPTCAPKHYKSGPAKAAANEPTEEEKEEAKDGDEQAKKDEAAIKAKEEEKAAEEAAALATLPPVDLLASPAVEEGDQDQSGQIAEKKFDSVAVLKFPNEQAAYQFYAKARYSNELKLLTSYDVALLLDPRLTDPKTLGHLKLSDNEAKLA